MGILRSHFLDFGSSSARGQTYLGKIPGIVIYLFIYLPGKMSTGFLSEINIITKLLWNPKENSFSQQNHLIQI